MTVAEHVHFDIQAWWKKHAGRYPILSEMAKDIMAIPMSSVAFETAFSTGGRVLSQFRSLHSKYGRSLICAENWFSSSSTNILWKDEEDEPETVLGKKYEDVELRKDGQIASLAGGTSMAATYSAHS
ncbi:hypothetical protein SASPL_111711 [Salvia splendens]|uniref:HAT C-terminal dimerisation domain-containing protein n=1 Tax=Salvia splendens TaxID=180675 RepID=A0A8X9A4K9_SALSN|nr:hypothetical protein SASPL_111711 [Salvia splendens]